MGKQVRRRGWHAVAYGAMGALETGTRWANNMIKLRNIGINARNAYLAARRKNGRTELDRPEKVEFEGHVALGKNCLYSKSSTNVKLGNYGRPHDDSTKSITWRWQSVVPYAPVADRAEQSQRSLDLAVVRRVNTEDVNGTTTGMFLPCYAFDLGTQPTQGRNSATKTTGDIQSMPLYRLRKSYVSAATALSAGTVNYDWQPVLGLNNFQSTPSGGSYSPYWNQEIKDTDPQSYNNVKRCWSEVELLFQCSRKMDCKIHVAVVKFDRFTGPRRQYTVNDQNLYVNGTAGTKVSNTSIDETVTGNDAQGTDVFWESWWDKRLAHPLAQYNQQNKTKRIRFIKHETIDVHPDPSELATTYNTDGTTVSGYSATTSGVTYTHHKKLFIGGGKWINCLSSANADATYGRGVVAYGQQPPVYMDGATGVAGADNGFTVGYGFNVVDRTLQVVNLVDDYARKHEDGNPWLLVWMEDRMPMSTHVAIGDARLWGPGYDIMTAQKAQCCSFDLKVRTKMLYCQPSLTFSSNAVITAGANDQ